MATTAAAATGATTPDDAFWEERWRKGVQPKSMWDIGKTEDCLVRGLELVGVAPAGGGKGKKALVPGCGRGYAVVTLAEYGFDALGLDISAASVAEAEANAKATFKPRDGSSATPRFVLGDFFNPDSYGAPAGGYDLVFDSTFLCAIPPAKREEWAQTMRRILAPGRGILVMNVYPMYPTLDAVDPIRNAKEGPFYDGPPFRLSEPHIQALLEPLGFRLTSHEAIPLEKMERKRELLGHASRESLMVWVAPGPSAHAAHADASAAACSS